MTDNYDKAADYARGMIKHGGNYEKQKFVQLAIEALEKQIPKMVVANGEIDCDDRWYGCPNCNEYITGYWADDSILYCINCGQRLDWEGVE